MNGLDILIGFIACAIGFLFMLSGYAIGFRKGREEGYTAGYMRGRNVDRAETRSK